MKELKAYNLSEEFFDKILETYSERVIRVKDFSQYINGGNFKSSIIFDGIKKIIIRESLLCTLTNDIKERNEWVQCICYKKHKQKNDIQVGITGGFAWRVMKSRIMKSGKYSEDEFNHRLELFEKDYNNDKVQYHFQYNREPFTIYKYTNCRKYDINGAYAKALTIIFPKASEFIIQMYNERKEHQENKDLINYFVGMMCIKNHRKTFNWIVQIVRELMEQEIEDCDGTLLYANTDGFAITSYKKEVKTSTILGEFKLEYKGDMYTYGGSNYWIIQAGNDITGSLLYQARKFVDLSKGKVIKYKRRKLNDVIIAEDITQEEIEEIIENG